MRLENAHICLIAGGMRPANSRLQPWRYLLETTHQLAACGCLVTILSDGQKEDNQWDVENHIRRLPSVSAPLWSAHNPLLEIVANIQSDCLLLHIGLSNCLHERFAWWGAVPAIGIWTSPLYTRSELAAIGCPRLLSNPSLSGLHILNTLIPRRLVSRHLADSGLSSLVVQTYTLQQQVHKLWQGAVEVIPPGVDECWMETPERNGLRAELGFSETDYVIAYFGSSSPLRGLPALLQAFEAAQSRDSRLRLLVLDRRRPGEPGRLPTAVRNNPRIKILSGFLSPVQVAAHVQACDAAALPFELVPSDAPISILEAQAAGITLITTRLGCLPELAEGGHHYLVEPGDVKSLARALLQAANEAGPVQPVYPSRPPRSWTHVGEDWAQLLRQL